MCDGGDPRPKTGGNGDHAKRAYQPGTYWHPDGYRNPDPRGREGQGRTNGKDRGRGPWWTFNSIRLLDVKTTRSISMCTGKHTLPPWQPKRGMPGEGDGRKRTPDKPPPRVWFRRLFGWRLA